MTNEDTTRGPTLGELSDYEQARSEGGPEVPEMEAALDELRSTFRGLGESVTSQIDSALAPSRETLKRLEALSKSSVQQAIDALADNSVRQTAQALANSPARQAIDALANSPIQQALDSLKKLHPPHVDTPLPLFSTPREPMPPTEPMTTPELRLLTEIRDLLAEIKDSL